MQRLKFLYRKLTVIHLHIGMDNMLVLEKLHLRKNHNSLIIEKFEKGSNQIAGSVKYASNTGYVLIITGSGILTKESLQSNIGSYDELFMQSFPTLNPNDFYIDTTGDTISISRKVYVDKLIEEHFNGYIDNIHGLFLGTGIGNWVASTFPSYSFPPSIGPFNVIRSNNGSSVKLSATGNHGENVGFDPFFKCNADELFCFYTALAFWSNGFSENYFKDNIKRFLLFRGAHAFSLFLLGVILLLLVVSNYFSEKFINKETQLKNRISHFNQSSLVSQNAASELVKFAQFEYFNTDPDYIMDRVVNTLPKNIYFNKFILQPITGDFKSEEIVTATNNAVIEGIFIEPTEFHRWTGLLSSLTYISKVEVNFVTYNNSTKKYTFKLTLTVL